VRNRETQYEKALTGASDEQRYRQDYDAPIIIPDDIAAVYLENNQSLQMVRVTSIYD
jgi:hypothetical protein